MANNKKIDKKSVNLLPTFFRTDKNEKFLSSTIDQLIKTPSLDRIDGFVGSKLSKNYNYASDVYINESLPLRKKYQLEPGLIIKELDGSIKRAFGFDDLINQINFYGGNTDNLDQLFRPKFNSYNPRIDWDKFVNFREYYWLPNGPEYVLIAGTKLNSVKTSEVSTYTVTDSLDGPFFVFTPDGLTVDPLLTFYRGVTYVFNVTSKHKFYFKTADTIDASGQYTHGITGNGTSTGQIIFTVDDTTPSILYYGTDDNHVVGGKILVKQLLEDSVIDIPSQILNKITYTSGNGVEFINGLKVRFVGNVTPAEYIDTDFIVEGVGEGIKLVNFSKLTSPDNIGTLYDTNFDGTPFDEFAFDNFKNIPLIPEYITINKSSTDLNPWTRYNRWFHSDIIKSTAEANGVKNPVYPQDQRASRPIIEFIPDMQLWNFGSTAVDSIDLIDTITTDAFSKVEKSVGYYVDGVKLEAGHRVIFNADTDPLVRGKIYEVSIVVINNQELINLTEVITPNTNDGVVINSGDTQVGKGWWFNGSTWVASQQRTVRNQAPMFDLFDDNQHSYSDPTYYKSEFFGNKIFGYVVGTGSADSVLGFPLKYYNDIGLEGTYLFNNFFGTENISIIGTNTVTEIPSYNSYIKLNKSTPQYINVWTPADPYQIPVLQFQVVTTLITQLPVTVFDYPGLINDLSIDVYVNDVKKTLNTDYTLSKSGTKLFVTFKNSLDGSTTSQRVLLKCYTVSAPNVTGTYETPVNLTNNPLNDVLTTLTLSEISDHVNSMVNRSPNFAGVFPGVSNLKSLPDITKYGSRLIGNLNPLSFAQCFITDVDHNLINSIRQASNDYYQFRLNLITFISQVGGQLSPADVLDTAMASIIQNKNSSFPYGRSDMIGYGNNHISRKYTVTDSRNKNYSLVSIFDNTKLSNRSVLVYLNNVLLTYGVNYTFEKYDASILILDSTIIAKGDVIVINDYNSTDGSYIPPTPTKLGVYPKYIPSIFIDYTYINNPVKVIQGHDGSITVAYSSYKDADDFRDLALLEYETRVYNNLKTEYNSNLLDVNDILPGVFRSQYNSYSDTYNIVQGDFLKWASIYGIDYSTNLTYDLSNHKTYNYKSATDNLYGKPIPGNWRGIYKYYFDTDFPDTKPWEMLGFSIKPSWWESEYGPAPYTSGNQIMWHDLELGNIKQGSRIGIDKTYARPGLSTLIPVDENGKLVDIRRWGPLAGNDSIDNIDQDWSFGDHGPAETAWRRSSQWPFAAQLIMALTKPADYAANMFDTSRITLDITGNYYYGTSHDLLNPKTVLLHNDTDSSGNLISAAGYSVWVIEHGLQRSADYVTTLKQDLNSVGFNLFYKAGGFLSKDKLEVIIDSIDPNSANPGVLLPAEDYTLHFNVSAPVKSQSISGLIIEKKNGQYVIKGYDKRTPYFIINLPIHQTTDSTVTVGGKSEPFLIWTANAFYQSGQVVYYSNSYYRVLKSHNTGSAFISANYSLLSTLPITGGVTVLKTKNFESTETLISYGVKYTTIQEVYDFILGYGSWLSSQGFIFDEYNKDLSQVLDWAFTGKEFIYWSTQNWADGSVIALSPFSNSIKYQFIESTVDNVLNSFYEYSLITADGLPYPKDKFSLSRENGVCTITTKNTTSGLFFARLNLVQKEHAIVLNNRSIFNDTVYDIDTGYRQSRIRLIGFKTAEWNGDFLSPGFIYDDAQISIWQSYTDYKIAEVVKYVGKYYSANMNVVGSSTFDFTKWTVLGSKPVAQLLPNFDYKINQFEDFYSLDIDNFDAGQQKMAQHLIGYTPRPYLDNIFNNPIAQYKFYQGFIKEKGTRNAIDKLAKASIHNLKGQINFNEEWAFRIGAYGNFTSYNQIEIPLKEDDFRENSQLIKFVDTAPVNPNDSISYINPSEVTIKNADYSSDNVFATVSNSELLILPVAGYVRSDDITATAYNKNSIVDIANNGNIKEGNTIWLGFKDNGEWDVYRYTKQLPNVIGSAISIPTSVITFTTDKFHNLASGDIVSIYGLDNSSDGVYIVTNITSLTTFEAATTMAALSESKTTALLFKFVSVRVGQFDDIIGLQDYITFKEGDLVWADTNIDGNWEVYKKLKNYNTSTVITTETSQNNQQFGNKIVTSADGSLVITSAPAYVSQTYQPGRVFVYSQDNGVLYPVVNYGPASKDAPTNYFTGTNVSNFGSSMAYDSDSSVIFAGAPNASYVGANSYLNEGFVKASTINFKYSQETVVSLLYNPAPQNNALYGSSIYISKEINQLATTQLLLVGAPGQDTVYTYGVVSSAGTSTITLLGADQQGSTGTQYGYAISGSSNGNLVAVSAPTANNIGVVYILSNPGVSIVSPQTISAPSICKAGDRFGTSVLMSDDGVYLFVSSTVASDKVNSPGKVFVYKNTGTQFTSTPVQVINNPTVGMQFGVSMSIDQSNTTLVVTSQGAGVSDPILIDKGVTTFDSNTCKFVEILSGSGSAFVFNRKNEMFIYAEELFDSNVSANSNYGKSSVINGSKIYIGAPNTVGQILLFDKIDPTVTSWDSYRTQSALVDTTKIKNASTIDTLEETIIDYLDIIDPVKGRISGLADQEIRYKTAFDPAVYSIGVDNVVVDTNSSWIEEHLGELWWDLSTVKYQWYEQGDIEYRKNTWGTLFPGTSIDIYEWVSSEYLPSQWSSIADTPAGLMQGISGQPKYPDNSVISVKQYYNATTGSTTNVYYFWVKNKVTVPDIDGRKIASSEVAGLIYNPSLYGTKYVSILASNALSITNVKDSLIANRIYLNISKDDIDNNINRHTEWLLLEENSSTSMPNNLLDKKLLDSLLGKDSVGNPVPDTSLPERTRYGIEIRPRQSLFKNRPEALRNLFEYTNTVLSQNIITDFVDFTNLNSKDEIPYPELGEYDKIVEEVENLYYVFVGGLKTAALSCAVLNGKIISVNIDEPGYGYNIAPNVTIIDDNSGAVIKTTINDVGEVVFAEVVNAGQQFVTAPVLMVRPYTVIVRTDSTINNLWDKYQYINKVWTIVHTQQYDTTKYWDYIDWISTNYDSLKPLTTTVDQVYLLDSLNLLTGEYVKVNNQGNGKYIILKKVDSNGTFNNSYDLLYSEKGTIKIKDTLWNKVNSSYNFDYQLTFDQSWFDQSPEIELSKILYAIKNDIFIGPLKVYWNKFFFKAVRYAMSEQKFLDWAFKTSFINVKNMAGELDQRPVYKFQNSKYYEDYINEVKPYHTKIRNFQVNYDIVDPTSSYTTDFDLPPTYDTYTDTFTPIGLDDPLMTSYPRKGWYDNYKFGVGRIKLLTSGLGYTSVPAVQIITAAGDTGSGATAVAYISLGKLIDIEITNAGTGYTLTPTVIIVGGGPTDLIPATALAILTNEKVRNNKIGIKFDRISDRREIGPKEYSDTFICDGNTFEFKLSWAAENKKQLIDIKLDGITVLSPDYKLTNYKSLFNGYHKNYSKIVLTYTPANGAVLDVTYSKNINLYNAVDRIEDYYKPTSGMPGNDLGQLMTGINYPGVQLRTLPFSYSANWDNLPFGVSSWGDAAADTDLDTIIDGGTWSTLTNTLINATGVNPSDIILDGDAFVSPNVSHAPEELLPGEVLESVGISVYTRASSGSPVISQLIHEVTSTSVSTLVPLTMLPPNTGTLMITFNNQILDYGNDYTVDFSNKLVTVSTQSTVGLLGITVVGIGGIDYISSDYATVSNTSTVHLEAEALYKDIGSVYVTLNGRSLTSTEYTFSTISSKNKRGRVTVNGLNTGTNTLQAWFFGSDYKGFSEVKEQRFTPTNGTNQSFVLDQFPGTTGPAHANAIVELNNKRLLPPNSVYYSVSNGQLLYDVDPNNEHPAGVFDLASLEVHINGIRIRNGIDFILDQPNQLIQFKAGFLKTGDVMAITNIVYSDYYITNGNLYIPDIPLSQSDVLKVITYTNHDGSLIRTETFDARSSRRYPMSRSLINDDYVWVSVGGNPLVNSFDYYVDSDNKTVIIKDTYPFNTNDQVIIVSMTDITDSEVIGYRIFKDILNRTHFKRLSHENSTRLSAPLYTTSTEIHVENSAVLSIPNPSLNLPGIILIAGERIEYMEISENTLRRIKRATLGTGARTEYPAGTIMIDQSVIQTVPYKETVVKTIITATSSITSYTLDSSIKFNAATTATDQVEVYYGGILLRKPSISPVIIHNPSLITFDSGETNAAGVSSDIELPPEFTITVNGSQNILNLNLDNITDGIRIVIIQKTAVDWYEGGGSLLTDPSVPANFLRDKQADLPDKYHYGQL